MTVWAIHNTDNKNLSDARRFGELRVINTRFIFPDEFERHYDRNGFGYNVLPKDVQTKLENAARQWDDYTDWLLPVGDMLQVAYFINAIAQRGGNVRILRFDRKEQVYLPAII